METVSFCPVNYFLIKRGSALSSSPSANSISPSHILSRSPAALDLLCVSSYLVISQHLVWPFAINLGLIVMQVHLHKVIVIVK